MTGPGCAESAPLSPTLRFLSSMATRALLADLAAVWQGRHGVAFQL
jgi:hypothetical protein